MADIEDFESHQGPNISFLQNTLNQIKSFSLCHFHVILHSSFSIMAPFPGSVLEAHEKVEPNLCLCMWEDVIGCMSLLFALFAAFEQV